MDGIELPEWMNDKEILNDACAIKILEGTSYYFLSLCPKHTKHIKHTNSTQFHKSKDKLA